MKPRGGGVNLSLYTTGMYANPPGTFPPSPLYLASADLMRP